MGLDFSALIHSRGPTDRLAVSIAHLEAGGSYDELQQVIELGRRRGFAFADRAGSAPTWRKLDDWEQVLPGRPVLPDPEVAFDLSSDFSLTFGADASWVYHSLRWLFFLTDEEWQRVMLDAIRRFCQLFEACDCIVTNDGHPSVLAVRGGAGFAEALEIAARQDEGEVGSLAELYREVESDTELALRPVPAEACELLGTKAVECLEGELVMWPRTRLLPEGWSRPTVWESKGYWRNRCLGPAPGSATMGPARGGHSGGTNALGGGPVR
jgi:hypothetical protein